MIVRMRICASTFFKKITRQIFVHLQWENDVDLPQSDGWNGGYWISLKNVGMTLEFKL